MKKVLLLATAAMLVAGVSFANTDKGKKKKKCAKGKTCCTKTATAEKKSCCKDKMKTVSM